MVYPQFFKVTQKFTEERVADVPSRVTELFSFFDFGNKIKTGDSVAVGVGSRGTHDLKDLVVSTVTCLRNLGLRPFITPAMGSHGAATGEGQAQLLRDLGISEKVTGCPIRATMNVTSLGHLQNGAEVFLADDALAADHIFVINRIKPHTAFRSTVESGLCKILAVGLGRRAGADCMHKYGLATNIVPAADLIIGSAPVLCGLAVTENARGETHSIRLVSARDFAKSDAEMLNTAWELLPRLPINQLDLLIVDRMGKDISGAGMDPNVIGFWRREGGERKPDYRTLAVLDLTPASHGNATGLGMADITTKALMAKVDVKATYMNALTSRVLRSARFPIPLQDDRSVFETALDMVPDPRTIRAARIIDTASLETFWVTEAVLPEFSGTKNIVVNNTPHLPEFTSKGRLVSFP